MAKASAKAYPIQGLLKYHGLKDAKLRIPYHDSISLCTGPIHSHTTVEVIDAPYHLLEIDGKRVRDRPAARVCAVVDYIRAQVGSTRSFKMVSRNDFPQYVGLGSSSSGFAALAVAAAKAYGWEATQQELSEAARLGAGSAARSVTGGISIWRTEGQRSFSQQLVAPDEIPDWRIIVPLVQHEEPTDNVHAEVMSSPFFEARNTYIRKAMVAMLLALDSPSVRKVASLAERDTLNLHAVAMTGENGHVTWLPATLEVMHRVRELRAQGVDAWFSIDTGATAYINTTREHEGQVAQAMEGIPGVARILHLQPAGPAHLVQEHLF